MSYRYLLAKGLRVMGFFYLGSGRNVMKMLVVCGCGGPIFELFRIFGQKPTVFAQNTPDLKNEFRLWLK